MSQRYLSVLVVACVWVPFLALQSDRLLGHGVLYAWVVFVVGTAEIAAVVASILLRWRPDPNRSTRLLIPLLLICASGLAYVYIGLHDMAVL